MGIHVDFTKRLPYFTVDLSFCCPKGMITTIVGPSGAGKTTLIRVVAGLEVPDTGTVRFNGSVWTDPANSIHVPPQQRGIGYVFQEYTLFPHLTVEGNTLFAAKDKDYALNLLQRFGIGHLRRSKPSDISGGERQRVAFAQILARKPKALLLDEPFSALDSRTRRMLQDELLRIRDDFDLPVLMVTHDSNEAQRLGDEVVVIEDGKLMKFS